jgi:hypothetical protein
LGELVRLQVRVVKHDLRGIPQTFRIVQKYRQGLAAQNTAHLLPCSVRGGIRMMQ